MKSPLLLLILSSVASSSVAQIALKTGMSQRRVSDALATGTPPEVALAIACNPWIIGGLTLYAFGAVIWLFVLARVEVSFAYPFVGIGFILTLILGYTLIGETITVTRMIGTLLVTAGVVLIARP